MRRMLFSGIAAALLALLPGTTVHAAGNGDDAKLEVIEFFWYGCPHCYRFQPHLVRWLQSHPDDVAFDMVPVVLNPQWEVHARAYYAAKLLGGIDRFHHPFYDAIHADGRSLNRPDDIAAFAATVGFDEERFRSAMDSFAVETRLQRAQALQREYRVSGTPSVGVAGEHTVSPREAGSFEGMIELIERHLASERGESG